LIGIYFELGWIYCLLDGVMNKISVEMNDAEVKYFFFGNELGMDTVTWE